MSQFQGFVFRKILHRIEIHFWALCCRELKNVLLRLRHQLTRRTVLSAVSFVAAHDFVDIIAVFNVLVFFSGSECHPHTLRLQVRISS